MCYVYFQEECFLCGWHAQRWQRRAFCRGRWSSDEALWSNIILLQSAICKKKKNYCYYPVSLFPFLPRRGPAVIPRELSRNTISLWSAFRNCLPRWSQREHLCMCLLWFWELNTPFWHYVLQLLNTGVFQKWCHGLMTQKALPCFRNRKKGDPKGSFKEQRRMN